MDPPRFTGLGGMENGGTMLNYLSNVPLAPSETQSLSPRSNPPIKSSPIPSRPKKLKTIPSSGGEGHPTSAPGSKKIFITPGTSNNGKAKCSIYGSLVLLARLEAHILETHISKRPEQFELEILKKIGELVSKPGLIYFAEFERYLFAKHRVQVKVIPVALLGALLKIKKFTYD
jgi:hypothetical protein